MIWKLIAVFVLAFVLGMITNAIGMRSVIAGTILVWNEDDDLKMRFVLDSEPDDWIKYKTVLFKIESSYLPDISQE